MRHFKNILCVVNGEQSSKVALKRAATLAENNQAKLTLAGVVQHVSVGMGMPENGPISNELQATMVEVCAKQIDAAACPLREQVQIETKVLVGIHFLEVIREVLRNAFDVVVKTAEHKEWPGRLFGSEDMHLLRKCPCPIWLIKPSAPKKYRRILAAVDMDNAHPPGEIESRQLLNQQVLELASSMALADFAELHIVHAWEVIGESAMRGSFMRTPDEKILAYVDSIRVQREIEMERLLRSLAVEIGQDALDYLNPEVHMVKGWVRKVIPALAKQMKANLIVMGTVARTGVPGFITGNTAESILNQIDCSVLAVKPVGFETPVTVE